MRVVFINIHTNGFYVQNMVYILRKQRAIDKHRFFLNWLLDHDIEVVNFVTNSGTTLPNEKIRKITNHRFIRMLESNYVLKKNNISRKKIKTVTDPDEIKDDDIVIFYGHFPDTQFDVSNGLRGYHVADLIHFYGDLRTSRLLKEKNIRFIVGEFDFRKYSEIFNINYSWFKGDYIERPFAFQDRFKNHRNFSERKCRVVAMGTITRCDLEEFKACYGTDVYQPKRKMIFDHVDELKEYVDSYISEFQETPAKIIMDTDSFISKWKKKIYNFYSCGQQKKYFSFDMVEKYNEYKMFICPEDAVGAYGVGVFEGMACGCAMIGWDYGAYEDLGFIPGEHYIPYDGSLENLIEVIKYYQMPENQQELERIAHQGEKFVKANFNQETVASKYYNKLRSLNK